MNKTGNEKISWKSICASYQNAQARPDLVTEILALRHSRENQRRRRHWGMTAAAALFLPLLISLMMLVQPVRDDVAMQRFKSINQPQQLKFVVNAKESHEHVTFSIKAPAQWTIYGYQGSQLSWNGRLKAGSNLLSIPLIAHKAVAGTLVVTISHKDAVKEYRIPVDVDHQPV